MKAFTSASSAIWNSLSVKEKSILKTFKITFVPKEDSLLVLSYLVQESIELLKPLQF